MERNADPQPGQANDPDHPVRKSRQIDTPRTATPLTGESLLVFDHFTRGDFREQTDKIGAHQRPFELPWKYH